jgi:hypothetical protein
MYPETENIIEATEQSVLALECQSALHPSRRCKATILAALTLIDDLTQSWFLEDLTVSDLIDLDAGEFESVIEELNYHIKAAQKSIDDYNERSMPCDGQTAWQDTAHLFGV